MPIGRKLIAIGLWLVAGVFMALMVPEMNLKVRIIVFVLYVFPVILFYAHSIAKARRVSQW